MGPMPSCDTGMSDELTWVTQSFDPENNTVVKQTKSRRKWYKFSFMILLLV